MDNNMQSPHISAPEENIDLRALLEKYLKKWYWFVISVTVCVGIALVYLVRAIPQYSVQTTLLLHIGRTLPEAAETGSPALLHRPDRTCRTRWRDWHNRSHRACRCYRSDRKHRRDRPDRNNRPHRTDWGVLFRKGDYL